MLTWKPPTVPHIEIDLVSDRVTYQPAATAVLVAGVRNLGDGLSDVPVEFEITEPFGEVLFSERRIIERIDKNEERQARVSWKVPDIGLSGFVARATVTDANGKPIASDHYVFDVAEDWVSVPRYGFFAIFPLESEDVDEKIRQMAEFHINSVQFYDWFEYHGNYTPTDSEYAILDKLIARSKVLEKIQKAQERGMRTMAYTAIYAAAESIYRDHSDWALTDRLGQPLRFVDWLYLVNPDRGSGWHDYLIQQLVASIGMFGWDGIHLDQYGEEWTKNPYWEGSRVDMENAFLRFVNDAVSKMRENYPQSKLIFNLVNAWPYETIAKHSMSDATYVEVWPPWDTYADIQALIRLGKFYDPEKAVILAAYAPNNLPSILLLDSVIFANQGFHIELGEGDGILVDPYFPRYQILSENAKKALATYYETITRYEAYIYDRDIGRLSEAAEVLNYESSDIARSGKVLVVSYSKKDAAQEQARIVHLVNFVGIESMTWKTTQQSPKELSDLQLRIRIPEDLVGSIEGVYLVDPDSGTSDPVSLEYQVNVRESAIELILPSLTYWDTVIVKFNTSSHVDAVGQRNAFAVIDSASAYASSHSDKDGSMCMRRICGPQWRETNDPARAVPLAQARSAPDAPQTLELNPQKTYQEDPMVTGRGKQDHQSGVDKK